MNTTAASLLESRAMQHSNQESFNNSTQKIRLKYPNICDYTEESSIFLKKRNSSK